jgi:uncharacterized membrane protein YfcA
MMSCTIISRVTTFAVLRRFIDWRQAFPMTIGGIAGLPIGLGCWFWRNQPPIGLRSASFS